VERIIGYAVEFAVMDPALRAKILASYPNAKPFEKLTLVCDELTYLSDVDLFGIQSYLTIEARGGKAFLARVLSGELKLPQPPHVYDCAMQ
jgi:hypothetical protein